MTHLFYCSICYLLQFFRAWSGALQVSFYPQILQKTQKKGTMDPKNLLFSQPSLSRKGKLSNPVNNYESVTPEIYSCPDCGNEVELRSDERECSNCNAVINIINLRLGNERDNDSMRQEKNTESTLKELVQLSARLGASDAAVIFTNSISAEDDLANLCREPQCENYGLSASCPPHVSGPSAFRKLLNNYKHAIVIKIDVPSEILLSNQRSEIFRLLHGIVAAIEQSAVENGFSDSKAYAGGSCKKLFCHNHADCRVLAREGECRNPGLARPSMSGFGINVSKLMKAAGMSYGMITHELEETKISMGTVCGLVLIG